MLCRPHEEAHTAKNKLSVLVALPLNVEKLPSLLVIFILIQFLCLLHDLFIDFPKVEAHNCGTVINVHGFIILVRQL